MTHFVEGSYASMKEAVQATNAMVTRGYSREDITFVTSESKKSELPSDLDIDISTDASHEALASYKEDIEQGHLVALVKEDPSIDNDQKTGATNDEADSPAEDPNPNSKLTTGTNSDTMRDNPTPGDVPVGDNDDAPGSVSVDEDHDLTNGL
ncbi:hypothetical protein VXN63_05735 [Marinilactibacillus sp. XAAS-LB27]|uniref:hypothetical protein n=1 Tax=Marinilactibacillus sp. XAAS-LB27 TaxID=3114538 RepID=UPI002E16BA42|nr:hypothetical protein [Marinilactibacillus sp. XAAS-LB27]